jgi:hypothetical protein
MKRSSSSASRDVEAQAAVEQLALEPDLVGGEILGIETVIVRRTRVEAARLVARARTDIGHDVVAPVGEDARAHACWLDTATTSPAI